MAFAAARRAPTAGTARRARERARQAAHVRLGRREPGSHTRRKCRGECRQGFIKGSSIFHQGFLEPRRQSMAATQRELPVERAASDAFT
eukprot:5495929-Pleurochrysis_carterae.AAC.1